jgi:hypothetical protein
VPRRRSNKWIRPAFAIRPAGRRPAFSGMT